MLELAVIVATHPEDNSVDAVLVRNGARVVGAQVTSLGASGRTGTVDLPEVSRTGDKWDVTQRDKDQQDVIGIIGYVGHSPVVLGFLYPQVNQMLFDDPKMRFNRHQSDVMTSIDGNGNIQLTHPSGAYVRIGEQPDKDDLASKNSDKSLAADRNTGRKVHVRIGLADDKVVVTLTPDGDVKFEMAKDLTIEADGKATIKVTGTTEVESGGAITIKAPSGTFDMPQATFTGSVQVDQGIHADQDIVAQNISLLQHKHKDVMSGPSTTGIPVP